MNMTEAREFEANRRRIAKAGLSIFARKAQKEKNVKEAFDREVAIAGGYAAAQGKVYGKDTLKNKPQSIAPAVKETVLWNVEAGRHVARQYDGDLRELGEYIACMTGTTWIHGPIKLTGWIGPEDRGAYNKTVKDNLLDWSKNKDLMRGTVACKTQEQLPGVVARIDIICSLQFGMKLEKRVEQKAKKDEGCGYSGWNFAVVMKGCSIPGEIQANTYAMMYAKMSQDDYIAAILKGNAAEYTNTAHKMGFEGGLQHLFYEIYQQIGENSDDGKLAAALSREYCDLARMPESDMGTAAPGITRQINVFHTKLRTAKAKEIWAKRILHMYGSYKGAPKEAAAAEEGFSGPPPVFRSIPPR
jgi:hypothetical protein